MNQHATASPGPAAGDAGSVPPYLILQRDDEHLRLLAIFFYISAALHAVLGCLPTLHVTIGLMMLLAPGNFGPSQGEDVFLRAIGLMFTIVAGAIILVSWALALANVLTGRFLSERRHLAFCRAVAIVECLFVPLGTLLGVFTLVVLTRPSIVAQFDAAANARD